ncbi:hypothetical protein BH09BAC2_BH09BAC2_03170 [soil metagenome]
MHSRSHVHLLTLKNKMVKDDYLNLRFIQIGKVS